LKRIGVIGAGRFGSALAEYLVKNDAEVLLLEQDMDIVQRMSSIVPKTIQGDASDVNALAELGFHECDAAVVAIGVNMEGSVLATMNLKELKVPYVVARAVSDTHGKVLERVGANLVVYPDKERAIRLAKSLLVPSALDSFEIIEGASVVDIAAPPEFVGKSLAETDIRRTHGVTVLAIKRVQGRRKKSILNPSGADIIEAGDTLVVFGSDKTLENMLK